MKLYGGIHHTTSGFFAIISYTHSHSNKAIVYTQNYTLCIQWFPLIFYDYITSDKAIYSASAVDEATVCSFLDFHAIANWYT